MMPLNPSYESKTPDSDGRYSYSAEEDAVWGALFERQVPMIATHAAKPYRDGLVALKLTGLAVPQVRDIDQRLDMLTGAGAEGVPALIPQEQFSTLLSQRKFPVATFIRRREDMDYLQEPDIFHEVFGHCPMLTSEPFCRFIESFGRLALELPAEYSPYLFRLFWFTVEFGLIREAGQIKAFGAGIMSSPSELSHAISGPAERREFDLAEVLRTDYRIDILQPVYFVLNDLAQLEALVETDLKSAIDQARKQGDLPRRFEVAA